MVRGPDLSCLLKVPQIPVPKACEKLGQEVGVFKGNGRLHQLALGGHGDDVARTLERNHEVIILKDMKELY